MRIVVIGASGRLGQQIGRQLRRALPDARLVGASRSVPDARTSAGWADWHRVDLADATSVRDVVARASHVVVAAGHDSTEVQEMCLQARAHCIDVSMSAERARYARSLAGRARAVGVLGVVQAGLIPGLSALLVDQAAAGLGGAVGRIDVGFLQSANARVGRTGAGDMLRLVAAPVVARGVARGGFRRRCPADPRLRLIAHPEAASVKARFPLADVHYWTGWDATALNTAVATACRLHLLPRAAHQLARLARHSDRRPEQARLVALVRGARESAPVHRKVTATLSSDYAATAAVVAALARLATDGLAGAGAPADVVDLATLLTAADGSAIAVADGTPPL